MRIELKKLNSSSESIEAIIRTPQGQKGWSYVSYKGKRYQVFDGGRVPPFINLDHPIQTKAELGEVEAAIRASR